MIPDQVTEARYDELPAGPRGVFYPCLIVTIDGIKYEIEQEQKLVEKYGIVTFYELDPEDFQKADQYTLVFDVETTPGNFEKTQGKAMTNDPRIVALYNQFSYDLQNDRFRPGLTLKIP